MGRRSCTSLHPGAHRAGKQPADGADRVGRADQHPEAQQHHQPAPALEAADQGVQFGDESGGARQADGGHEGQDGEEGEAGVTRTREL